MDYRESTEPVFPVKTASADFPPVNQIHGGSWVSLSVEGVKLFSAMMEMLRQMQITTETIDKFISLSSKSFRK